jgi:hypothetical protein
MPWRRQRMIMMMAVCKWSPWELNHSTWENDMVAWMFLLELLVNQWPNRRTRHLLPLLLCNMVVVKLYMSLTANYCMPVFHLASTTGMSLTKLHMTALRSKILPLQQLPRWFCIILFMSFPNQVVPNSLVIAIGGSVSSSMCQTTMNPSNLPPGLLDCSSP